jgi:hypothetical protein
LRKLSTLIALGIMLAMGVAAFQYACAEEADPIVRIFDSAFTAETDYFSSCPVTVGIKTMSNVEPYDLVIVEPDGITTHTIATGLSAGSWHSFTYTCTKTGWWTAKAGSASIPFGIGTFFVIPFAPLGALSTVTIGLGTLGALRLKRGRGKPKM